MVDPAGPADSMNTLPPFGAISTDQSNSIRADPVRMIATQSGGPSGSPFLLMLARGTP